MIAPALPDHIHESLRNVRETMRLVWNPRAKVKQPGSFDAFGNVREGAVYEPRWEVWDTDPDGQDYRVMTVMSKDGEYRQPGAWLVELLNYINPTRFGGRVDKLLNEMIDKPNAVMLEVDDKQFDDLADQAVKWHMWANTPKQRVTANIGGR